MFNMFKNVSRYVKYNNELRAATKLVQEGKKEQAFNQFNALLNSHPYDAQLGHQLIILGKELHKEVILPGEYPRKKAGSSPS